MSTSVKCTIIKCDSGSLGLTFILDGREIRTVRDLTYDHTLALKICDSVNRSDLSPIHIDDILEDFIG